MFCQEQSNKTNSMVQRWWLGRVRKPAQCCEGSSMCARTCWVPESSPPSPQSTRSTMGRAGTAPVRFSLSSSWHAVRQRAKRTDHAAHHGLRPIRPCDSLCSWPCRQCRLYCLKGPRTNSKYGPLRLNIFLRFNYNMLLRVNLQCMFLFLDEKCWYYKKLKIP